MPAEIVKSASVQQSTAPTSPSHQSPSSVERRLHPRYAMPAMYVPICIHRIATMVMQHLDGHVYDLSQGGMRFELDQPLTVGEMVRFTVELPCGNGCITGTACVVRVHDELDDPGPRRMAVQTQSFDDQADLARLQEYLEHRQILDAA